MLKIIYVQNYNGKKVGYVEVVNCNVAHGLREKGVIELFNAFESKQIVEPVMDKQMKPSQKTRGEIRRERRQLEKEGQEYNIK